MPTRTLTDTWLDVHAAAAYAGVPFTVIAAALADHELPALTPDPERPAHQDDPRPRPGPLGAVGARTAGQRRQRHLRLTAP